MPASSARNFNPYSTLIRTMIKFAALLNLAAIAGWVIGEQFAGIILGMFAFMVMVLVLAFYASGKKASVKIRRLIEGNLLLARWEYPGNIFVPFIAAEYRRQMINANITAGVILLAGPFVGMFKDGMPGLSTGIAIGVGLALFAYLLGFAMARDFQRKASIPPHEAFISSSSVYLNGMYIDWNADGTAFVSAEIKNDEETGRASIFVVYTVRGRYGKQTKEVYIPIPDGKHHDAERIIAQLS